MERTKFKCWVCHYRFNLNLFGGDFLFSRVGEVSDEVGSLLRLLQASKYHLCARDVLLWVFQVDEKCVLIPGDTLGNVGISVGVSGSLASLAAKETVQVGTSLVLATGFNCVALRTALDKQLKKKDH